MYITLNVVNATLQEGCKITQVKDCYNKIRTFNVIRLPKVSNRVYNYFTHKNKITSLADYNYDDNYNKNRQTFNMILYSQYLDISLRTELFDSCFHTIQDDRQHFYGTICNLVELLIQVAHGNQFP